MRWIGLVATVLIVAALATGCGRFGPGGDNGNKVSTVVYHVSGHGQAQVSYSAQGTPQLTRDTVSLPWQTTVSTVDHSQTVYQVRAAGPKATGLTCSIVVNGFKVNSTDQSSGHTVDCSFVK